MYNDYIELNDYVKRFRNKSSGRVNWKQCFKQGHEEKKAVIMQFSTSESLRSQYNKRAHSFATSTISITSTSTMPSASTSTIPPTSTCEILAIPISNNGSLQYRDVSFIELNDQLLGVTLIVRTPKEIKPKASKLGLGKYQNLCPVRTLKAFVQRTKDFTISLEEEHTLFLVYLGNGRTSAKSIQPKTASRWLEGIMQDPGINTNKIKAHSLRSAASTKAVSLGVPIEQIKLHANWSLTSNTFEDYYYRPRNQHKRGSDIVNTVFGEVTKNITTSEVGVEATAIVVGTTHNGYVAETKTKDVVAPLPWYRRLF
ncbi:hypothetical protein G6F70_008710 [Rhizopus microsporus]|nr:hypothetical protein G6F71_002072 [Rhizopus microsporus]KAG1194822.1 hypothetical protein G6F70_008710 [Rhizopus microsporus]